MRVKCLAKTNHRDSCQDFNQNGTARESNRLKIRTRLPTVPHGEKHVPIFLSSYFFSTLNQNSNDCLEIGLKGISVNRLIL